MPRALEKIKASIRAAHALGRVWEIDWMPLRPASLRHDRVLRKFRRK